MKTSSSMYAASHVGMMALTHSSTFHTPSLFTQIHLKILQNSNKFTINSNKLE